MFALALTACASNTRTQSKVVPVEKAAYSKILVVALSKNGALRSEFESELVGQLASSGVSATDSIKFAPHVPVGAEAEKIPEDKMDETIERLKAEGYDGVLLTRLIDVEEERRRVGGNAVAVRTGSVYGYGRPGVRGYWSTGRVTVWTPSHIETDVVIDFETRLYDLRKDRESGPEWEGLFAIDKPDSPRKAARNLAKDIAKATLAEAIAN